MARRTQFPSKDIIEATAKFPWWVGVVLAVATYFLLHWIARQVAVATGVYGIGTTATMQILKTVATIMQYVIPIVFLVGAARSALTRPRARTNNGEDGQKIEPTFTRKRSSEPERADKWSLELLRAIDWKRFEELCAEYFRVLGFRAVTHDHGPDGGIDITLYTADDPTRIATIVQCKQWTRMVGPKAMRELLGVMVDQKVAEEIFIASSSFHDEASRLAKDNHIDPIDGADLLRHILALSPEQQECLLKVATEGDYLTPTCMNCGIKMVWREDNNKYTPFWGCQNYPRCKNKLYVSA